MELTVEEFTSSGPVTVDLNAPLSEGLHLMKDHGIRHLPVIDAGEVVGVVSERDLLANFGKPWAEHLRMKEIMSTSLLFVQTNDGIGEVAYRLSEERKGSAIVLDEEGRLYGIFTTTDALNALVEILRLPGKKFPA